MITNFTKHIIRCGLTLTMLVLAPYPVTAAGFVGTPADPYDPTPENCGKPGHTPTIDHANQIKSIMGESIQPSNGPMFSKLGFAYLKGCGPIKQDFEEAKYWLEYGARQKDPIAMINLAWMIQNGIEFEADRQKSESLYQFVIKGDYQPSVKKRARAALAALTGDESTIAKSETKKSIAVTALIGTPADPFDPNPVNCGKLGHTPTIDHANQIKSIMGESIQPRNGPMFSKLGFAYLRGCGSIKQDFEEAKYWLEYGAKQKDPIATFNLAWMIQNGIAHEKNLAKAKELYSLAAKLSPALVTLAENNLDGTATEKAALDKIDVNAGIQSSKSANTTKSSAPLKFSITPSTVDNDGRFTIAVQSSNKLASLKINGRDEGETPAGRRIIQRAVPVGVSKFKIELMDEFGQTALQEISVNRDVIASVDSLPALNPAILKNTKSKDAIALIIGIESYKNAPKAEFAETDASQFYDYARKALGVPDNRIKLLKGSNASKFDILKQIKTWLAAEVNAGKTDVYVFYSGHGLASADGKTSYLLPFDADTALLEESSIKLTDFVNSINSSKPKSLALFMDSCYSGQGKNGATLLASARPVSLKPSKPELPDNVTILTSAAGDQIAISAPELRHGLFSYFVMKGLEGTADANADGTISMQELHEYVSVQVAREATRRGSQQSPTLQGSGGLVLVTR
jgi:TPR repeat protein